MSLTLTKEQVEKLENFIGYGRLDAKYIFLGLEEGGKGDINNLKERLSIENYSLLDCREFHLNHLAKTLNKYKLHHNDDTHAVHFQSVWKFMSYFVLRMEGTSKEELEKNNRLKLRQYQNTALGTMGEHGSTLLTEIFPIPCPTRNSWHQDVFPHYKNKKDYEAKVLPKRKDQFKELLNSPTFQADYIICYGKSKWPKFQDFFSDFSSVKFNSHFIENREYKQAMLKGKRNTTILLLPFLGNGQMSYSFLDSLISTLTD